MENGAHDTTRAATEEASTQAKQVATEVKDQAREVATEVRDQAQDLLQRAQSELRTQAQTRTEHAVQSLRSMGDQLQAVEEGRVEDAKPLLEYAGRARQRVQDLADRLEQRGFEGAVQDMSGFARRRPGTFLLGCAATGFVLTRLMRSAPNGDSGGNGMQSHTSTTSWTGYGERSEDITLPSRPPVEPLLDPAPPSYISQGAQ